MKNILFVCLGNICRSPSAEAVFRKRAEEMGWKLSFDSAGTIGHHKGEASDSRSIKHAEKRGYSMTHRARPLEVADFEYFDLILVMDQKNFRDASAMAPELYRNKIMFLTDYKVNLKHDYVPDPYYGGPEDFELVLDIIEDAWKGFVNKHSPSGKE